MFATQLDAMFFSLQGLLCCGVLRVTHTQTASQPRNAGLDPYTDNHASPAPTGKRAANRAVAKRTKHQVSARCKAGMCEIARGAVWRESPSQICPQPRGGERRDVIPQIDLRSQNHSPELVSALQTHGPKQLNRYSRAARRGWFGGRQKSASPPAGARRDLITRFRGRHGKRRGWVRRRSSRLQTGCFRTRKTERPRHTVSVRIS
jgi:hypothetical protein